MNEHEIPIPRCFSDSRVLVPNAVQSVSQNKAQRQFWDADAQRMRCKALPDSAPATAARRQGTDKPPGAPAASQTWRLAQKAAAKGRIEKSKDFNKAF